MLKPIEIVTVVAIIPGPVLALFAQRVLDWLREKRNQRVQLFLSLMASRALQLSLWQRLLGRLVSEYGRLCHGDGGPRTGRASPEGANVAYGAASLLVAN